jgi:catechol 2,3-dioxygenase-like lactoylglutathione lyase family enzyme
MSIVTRIDHVAVYVSDLERSLDWYSNVLDVPIAYKGEIGGGETGAFIDVGDTILAFLINDDPRRDLTRQHFAFAVRDVDAAYAALRAKGVAFDFAPVDLPEGYVAGQRYCDLRDPDGVRLELVQRPPGWRRERVAESTE